ncbi:MAG: hypothetical protein JW751_28735 [Polyangiaceae bacterium]|nr:hypothetical protein [Polyangiaceae bacterium]
MKRATVARVLSVMVALVVPAACAETGVVGGDCARGLGACDGHCVDLSTDNDNCGRCGQHCPESMPCGLGICGGDLGRLDGGLGGAAGAAAAGAPATAGVSGSGGREAGGTAGASGGGFAGIEQGGTGPLGAQGGMANGGTQGGAGTGAEGTGVAGAGVAGAGGLGGAGVGGAQGGVGTGGSPSGGWNGGEGGGSCVPPFNDPAQCGDCTTQCTEPTPRCAPVGGGEYACVAECDPGLTDCNGACVDLNSDPFHCGSCSRQCPSGICQLGECVGARFGNVALLCMNYRQTYQGRPQEMLLGNSVFLPARNPVRVLAYVEYATAQAENQVVRTLDWASATRGRIYDWSRLEVASELTNRLSVNDFDVFLVLDQTSAPAGTLASIGASWSTALDSFPRAGGTVVVLSGGSSENVDLLDRTGLFSLTGERSLANTQIYNRAPADALGLNVVSQFVALQDTCVFETSVVPDESTTFVVTDTQTGPLGDPVVVHRTFAP